MFGIYRTILALVVVVEHLGEFPMIGRCAVFGFYTLSGYLMTLILQTSYGYSWQGFKLYVVNRALRIYPLYWAGCLLSIALILWVGRDFSRDYLGTMFLPRNLESAVRNFLIFFSIKSTPRLVSPTWALSVELLFYFLIGVGISRTQKLSLLWFAASIIYAIYVNYANLDWNYRYYSVFAASLPFSTGALIYHYNKELTSFSIFQNKATLPILAGVILVVFYFVSPGSKIVRVSGFYISYLLQSMMIISLSSKNIRAMIPSALDQWIGYFSYPIYLTHYQAGLIISKFTSLQRGDLNLLLMTIPLVLAISLILIYLIEYPFETLRRKIKQKVSQ